MQQFFNNRYRRYIIPAIPDRRDKEIVLSATHRLLRFGLFELNLDTEELRKDGVPIKLGPQPFRVLAMLAGRSGQIVSREEIRQAVWGDETYVDFEHGLNQCIKQIRTSLIDDSTNPLYIETLPRKGYRFLAPVTSKTVAVIPKVTASTSGVQPRALLPPSVNRPAAGSPLAGSSAVAPAPATEKAEPVAAPPEVSANEDAAAAEKAAPEPSTRSRLGRYGGWLAVPVLAVIAIAFYWHSQNAHALMEKDTVVVGDFANSTGEAVFDDTLKQALRIALDQSPFLNLVSDQKVNATLRLTGRAAGERLTPEVTRDICQRVSSKAMLNGSIAQLGSQFVIGVQAVNCNTGEVLAEALEQAKNKEDVLKALDRATLSVRRKLGESLRTVENFATPVEEATTPSLEALKAYSVGREVAAVKGDTAALPYYKQAVELDPNFAMAYRYMASAYTNLNEVGRAAENARRAFELRGKVSERERLFIEGHYYLSVTGELEKSAHTWELRQQAYPRDPVPYTNLAYVYSNFGDYEKGLAEAREALRLEPNKSGSYSNLGQVYLNLNRLDNAEAVYKEAEERKLEGEWILGNRYQLAFLKGDSSQMANLLSTAMGKPGVEDILLASQADTDGWYGKLHSADELTRRAMDSSLHNDAKETAASYQVAAALREAESGNWSQAQAAATAAVRLAPNRDVRAMAALALARAGDTAGAEKLAAELNGEFQLSTVVQKYWLPTIGAAIALNHNDPNKAVQLLKVASPIELGTPTQAVVFLCPIYVRGEAYLMLHQGSAARAEFQKFIDHQGIVVNFPWGALARLGLARAYALEAQTDPAARDKARAAYQDFLTLWKDADPDVPVLKQAKAEYAKLQ